MCNDALLAKWLCIFLASLTVCGITLLRVYGPHPFGWSLKGCEEVLPNILGRVSRMESISFPNFFVLEATR